MTASWFAHTPPPAPPEPDPVALCAPRFKEDNAPYFVHLPGGRYRTVGRHWPDRDGRAVAEPIARLCRGAVVDSWTGEILLEPEGPDERTYAQRCAALDVAKQSASFGTFQCRPGSWVGMNWAKPRGLEEAAALERVRKTFPQHRTVDVYDLVDFVIEVRRAAFEEAAVAVPYEGCLNAPDLQARIRALAKGDP